jgi:hypothetical protein
MNITFPSFSAAKELYLLCLTKKKFNHLNFVHPYGQNNLRDFYKESDRLIS